MANNVGIFIILIIGLGLALLIGFGEFFWEAHKTVKSGSGSWSGVFRELCSDLFRNTKPVLAKSNNDSPDGESRL